MSSSDPDVQPATVVLLFQGLIAPRTQGWPLLLRSAAFPLVVVPTLTYLLMPLLSPLTRRWLYPARRTHRPAQRTDRRDAQEPTQA
jgi:antibiotic biosynthesis monooxygenase (ABM) superfamily enzyme